MLISSIKHFKGTDRELNAMSNILLSDNSLQDIRSKMGNDKEFLRRFGRILDKDGHLLKEYDGVSVLNKTQMRFLLKDMSLAVIQQDS